MLQYLHCCCEKHKRPAYTSEKMSEQHDQPLNKTTSSRSSISSQLCVPEDAHGWLSVAAFNGKTTISHHEFSLMMSCCPVGSALLL
jgi:hypothetical protein